MATLGYYFLITLTLALSIYTVQVCKGIVSSPSEFESCSVVRDEMFTKVSNLTTPIVLYTKMYEEVYINHRGSLTFNDSHTGGFILSSKITIKLTNPSFNRSTPMIAPFWTFPSTTEQVCYWNVTDYKTIQDYLHIFEIVVDFNATLLFAATWEYSQNMIPYKIQAILLTDGQKTLSRFLYNNTNYLREDNEYLIGFNAGNHIDGIEFARQNGSMSSELLDNLTRTYRIDGKCIAVAGSSCTENSHPGTCSPFPDLTATSCKCNEGAQETEDNCTVDDSTSPATVTPISNAITTVTVNDSRLLIIGITGGVVGPLLIVCIVAILVVVLRRIKVRHRNKLVFPDSVNEMRRPSLVYAGSMIKLVQLPKELKIPFHHLKFDRKIVGEGEFGTVYKARYRHQFVAVKVLKAISGTFEVSMVVEEIIHMAHISHPSILSMIGVSVDNHSFPCIVMPFMWNGSLDHYLKRSKNKEKYFLPVNIEGKKADVEVATGKLLEMCLQIVQGMSYLSSERIIHRDLAARNCMVDLNGNIKVADFGLSVSISEDKDYFKLIDEIPEKLPVRWMAVESIVSLKFSEASDVWSYGVTCWEVFSCGDRPYPELLNKDVVQNIKNGYQMKKPSNAACNDSIYDVIVSCWALDPADRPNFQCLEQKVSSLLTNLKDYLLLMPESSDTKKCSKQS